MNIETILEQNDLIKLKRALKNSQIDLNYINENEESLLFIAIKKEFDLDTIKSLIELGADYNYCNSDGLGIIDIAIEKGNLDIITYLVDEKKVDINNTKRRSGFTPLMSAVCYNRVEVVKFLFERGVDIKQRDNNGLSALDYAKKLRLKKMEELLKEF